MRENTNQKNSEYRHLLRSDLEQLLLGAVFVNSYI